MGQNDNEAYLKYYDTHPEDFRDEPVLGACGRVSLKNIKSEESAPGAIERSAIFRRKRWEDYHLAKAQDLGCEIDVELLHGHFPLRGSNFDIL